MLIIGRIHVVVADEGVHPICVVFVWEVEIAPPSGTILSSRLRIVYHQTGGSKSMDVPWIVSVRELDRQQQYSPSADLFTYSDMLVLQGAVCEHYMRPQPRKKRCIAVQGSCYG